MEAAVDGAGGPAPGAATPGEAQDFLLSESSPEAEPRATSTRRSQSFLSARSASPAPRGKPPTFPKVSKPPSVSSKFRSQSLGARRGAARSPSPAPRRPELADHKMVTTNEQDVDSRIKALEAQQQRDHAYIGEIVQAIRALNILVDHGGVKANEHTSGISDFAHVNLEMRKEIFALRSQLDNAMGSIEKEIPKHIQGHLEGATGHAIENRIIKIEKVVEMFQQNLETVERREGQVEEELVKDGRSIQEAFKQAAQEISQVRGVVQKFEAVGNVANVQRAGVTVPFTREMCNSMGEIFNKMKVVATGIENVNGVATAQHARIEVLERIAAEHAVAIHAATEAPRAGRLNLASSFGGNSGCAGASCQDGCCDAPPPNPWAPAGAAPPAPTPPGLGASGSSPHGDPWGTLQAVTGGNNRRHCIHVTELTQKLALLEAAFHARHETRQGGTPPPDFWAAAAGQLPPRTPSAAPGRATLPLPLLGPLGAIAFKDKSLFDDKLALQEEFRFAGIKGGIQWKGKVERHFISRAPILKELLEWAEKEDMEEISEARFLMAVGNRLTAEQVAMTNAAIWGFLSTGISGPAEATFKRAATLNGLDAWRRMARYIDHGRGIRLETLRREVKMLHMKPIRNLEGVEQGIIEFENTMIEYAQAGGTTISDDEMKSDLLAILPLELRETLLWKAQDGESFQKFRDHVILQTSKILMNRQCLPVHALDEGPEEPRDEATELADMISGARSVEDILAAVQRYQNKRGTGRRPPPPTRRKEEPTRPPRKCPNCGGTHEDRRCPKPPVENGKRPCWNCGEAGHIASKCPAKTVRAIEDGTVGHVGELKAMFMVDDEGFQKVPPRHPRGTRPMPSVATLGNYISPNTFAALSEPHAGRKASRSKDALESSTDAERRVSEGAAKSRDVDVDYLPIEHPDRQWEILKRVHLGQRRGPGRGRASPLMRQCRRNLQSSGEELTPSLE